MDQVAFKRASNQIWLMDSKFGLTSDEGGLAQRRKSDPSKLIVSIIFLLKHIQFLRLCLFGNVHCDAINKERAYCFIKMRLMAEIEAGTIAVSVLKATWLGHFHFVNRHFAACLLVPLPWQVRCEFFQVSHGSYLPHHSPENVHSANAH